MSIKASSGKWPASDDMLDGRDEAATVDRRQFVSFQD